MASVTTDVVLLVRIVFCVFTVPPYSPQGVQSVRSEVFVATPKKWSHENAPKWYSPGASSLCVSYVDLHLTEELLTGGVHAKAGNIVYFRVVTLLAKALKHPYY